MITEIFTIMAPVLACAAIGFFGARQSYAFDPEFISRLVLNVAVPCLMLSVLGSVEIDIMAFQRTALACVLLVALMAVPGIMVTRLLSDDVRAYLPSFVFPNVGNMGLPVCLLANIPILYAIVIALLLLWSGLKLPAAIQNSVSLIGGMTIPLMLITLGVSLQRLQVRQWRQALLYSLLRIFGGLTGGNFAGSFRN